MLTVSVLINCGVEEVWSYLTTPENWYWWFCEDGGFNAAIGVEAVRPDWEQGADIVWSRIGTKPSKITKLVEGKELSFDAGWEGVVSFRLKTKREGSTEFEIRKKEGGYPLGQKVALQKMLAQFKARVEQEYAAA